MQSHEFRVRYNVPLSWCNHGAFVCLDHVQVCITRNRWTGFSLPAKVRRIKRRRSRADVWIDVRLDFDGTDSPGEAWDVFLHDVARPPGCTTSPDFYLPRAVVKECQRG